MGKPARHISLSYQLFGFPSERRGFPRALPTSRIIDGLNSLDSLRGTVERGWTGSGREEGWRGWKDGRKKGNAERERDLDHRD